MRHSPVSPCARRPRRQKHESLERRLLLSASPLGCNCPICSGMQRLEVEAVEIQPVLPSQDVGFAPLGVEGSDLGGAEIEQLAALGAFNIVINAGPTLAASPLALAAFEQAAAAWEAFISDPITVTIAADLANLGSPSVIGQTSTIVVSRSYTQVRNAMAADADVDDGILASLPTSGQISYTLPTGFSTTGNIQGAKANLKAINIPNLDSLFGATDATITFNTQFAFDYDNSNGVGAGLWDFETVAIHELGHALGFISIVDTVDALKAASQTGSVSPRPLDLFRFANSVAGQDPATANDFTNFPRFLDTAGSPIFDDISAEYFLSTGVSTGDGRQASHWKDNNFVGGVIGVMDPTLASQQIIGISAADLRALDLMGYDIVPNQAPVLGAIGEKFVNEGSLLTFTATASDPEQQSLTFSLGAGAPAGAAIDPNTGVFTWTPADSFAAPVPITILVTDSGNPQLSDSETIQVTVPNVAPSAAITAEIANQYRGESVLYTLTAADPSSVDQASNFTWQIDWNNDFVADEVVIGPSGTTVAHQYFTSAPQSINVWATDKDGGTGNSSSAYVSVSTFVTRTSGSTTDLYWGGTPGLDAVYFVNTSTTVQIFRVAENSVFETAYNLVTGVNGRIKVYGYDDIDILDASLVLHRIVELYGGDGNDNLYGGSRSDSLYGGLGDDLLVGALSGSDIGDRLFGEDGRDALFGAFGADTLNGGAGEDLLVADAFVFGTQNYSTLTGAAAVWASPEPYQDRVDALLLDTLLPAETVVNDGATDRATGGADLDWFFSTVGQDLVLDLEGGEIETDADP